jgi:hypothetical protein
VEELMERRTRKGWVRAFVFKVLPRALSKRDEICEARSLEHQSVDLNL